MNGWKKIFHANGNEKKAGMAYLDKIHFKTKNVKREEYYIMLRGSIQQEDIILVNIYAFNMEAPTNPCEFQHKMSLKDRHIACLMFIV